MKFRWSGPSGTGSELLSYPRSIAIFMALMNERRIPEALGAAFYVQGDQPLIAGNTDARIEFLRTCGVDWETAFVGAEIEEERNGMGACIRKLESKRTLRIRFRSCRHARDDNGAPGRAGSP